METLVRDVPIDLDETVCSSSEEEFTTTSIGHRVERSNTIDSSAASGSTTTSDSYEAPDSWSSSSGSFYDDLETSPIELGEKWYWHPNEEPEDNKNGWNGENETGYLCRSSGIEESKPKATTTETIGSTGQIFLRTVWNRDIRGQDKVMAKRVQSNREIELLQYLNTPVARYDPWNPSPPLLSIVNDDENSDEPLAIFDPLVEYSSKPFATVEEVLDFVMQLLQGLVFLHENRVVHGDIHGDIVMMDKPSSQETQGSRTRCVRYYLVDYTHASIVDGEDERVFQEDLKDLGIMIDRALGNIVPELSEIIGQMSSLEKTSKPPKASQILEDLETLVSDMPNSRIKASL